VQTPVVPRAGVLPAGAALISGTDGLIVRLEGAGRDANLHDFDDFLEAEFGGLDFGVGQRSIEDHPAVSLEVPTFGAGDRTFFYKVGPTCGEEITTPPLFFVADDGDGVGHVQIELVVWENLNISP